MNFATRKREHARLDPARVNLHPEHFIIITNHTSPMEQSFVYYFDASLGHFTLSTRCVPLYFLLVFLSTIYKSLSRNFR